MSRTTNIENKPPLGALIATRLKEMDKKQKWLAAETQISTSYLCMVLAGKAKHPTIRLLYKIADALNIDGKVLINALLSER